MVMMWITFNRHPVTWL